MFVLVSALTVIVSASLFAAENPANRNAAKEPKVLAWSVEDAVRAIRKLVKDPTYPVVHKGVDEALSLVSERHVFQGRESANGERDRFVVDMERGYIWVAYLRSRRDPRYTTATSNPWRLRTLVKADKAKADALRIAKANTPFFGKFDFVLVDQAPCFFRWRGRDRTTGIFVPAHILVFLDKLNGKLVEFHSELYDYRIRPKWNLTERAAVEIAQRADARLRDAKLRVIRTAGKHYILNRYLDLWEIEALLFKQPNGKEYGPLIRVDDETGKVWDVHEPS